MARVELRTCARNGSARPRPSRRRSRDRGWRVRGGAGAVGLRQVDDAADARGHLPADRRRHHVRRRAGQRRRGARPQRRHRVPVLRALSEHDGAATTSCSRLRFKTSNAARPSAARARSPRSSASTRCSTGGRASSRAASSNALRSRARWSSGRTCCCSTSRCRTSTRRCG